MMGRLLTTAALLSLAAGTIIAGSAAGQEPRASAAEDSGGRGWTVHVDNDLFAFTDNDRDYTAGFSVTLGGDEGRGNVLSGALDRLDHWSGFGSRFANAAEKSRSLEVGLVMFTPQDIGASEPLRDDRPYANLAYVSTSQLTHETGRPVAWQSSMTLGVLGLPFAEALHRGAHDLVGSREPMGYGHQISDGGEPTFRYAVSQYRLLKNGAFDGRPYHLRLGTTASVGYLTEANAELEFRWGNFEVPWWSSLPSASDYAGHPPMKAPRRSYDRGLRVQVSAGLTLRARLYNSFLQGQFRSSDVEFSSSRLNHLLLEAWAGVTTVFSNNLSVSYTIRHQTEELDSGPGARSFTWASIGVAQQF